MLLRRVPQKKMLARPRAKHRYRQAAEPCPRQGSGKTGAAAARGYFVEDLASSPEAGAKAPCFREDVWKTRAKPCDSQRLSGRRGTKKK